MILYTDLKPELEWVESNGRHFADTYEIKQTPNGKWLLMWTIDNDHYHNSLSEAKAVAQYDYEWRTEKRFVKVEVCKMLYSIYGQTYVDGYNKALEDLQTSIDKATEAKP